MIEPISEYYKNKGFDNLYININKEPRRVALLRNSLTKELKSMSYAKYLYTSYYECDIDKGFQVDHINNDKMDDRIENLQILSQSDNIRKSKKPITFITLVCPVCNTTFEYQKRNLSSHKDPCCSKRCGGIKSHWKK